jgi:hypothetical protein
MLSELFVTYCKLIRKLKLMKNFTLLLFFSVLTFSLDAQDDCASAIVISAGVTSVGTIDGTVDNACGWATSGTSGEWYAYTAPIDGVVTVNSDLPQNDGVTNSDDTRLSVFTGTCGALSCYTFADDTATNFLTTVAFAVNNGTTYYLHWDDRWSDAPFDFELTETVVNCPDGTLPFSDDFTDPNTLLVCWETLDEDGDGQGWFAADYDQDGDMMPDGNPMLGSASWTGTTGPLTPDNWLISPAIDLTPFSSGDTIELTWIVRGIDPAFAAENYSVYAATGNAPADFTSSGTSFTETLVSNDPDGDGFGNFENRSLDLSAFAGQSIFVAFRHHAVTDQFVINLDNIAVDATLGINDLEIANFNHYYNATTTALHLKSSTTQINQIEIFSLVGQSVLTKTLSGRDEVIDLSAFNDGVYMARVTVGDMKKTIKFMKY